MKQEANRILQVVFSPKCPHLFYSLFLEIKLLWMGLASRKWAQLLCCYCQQHILYVSQATEYYKAARFSTAQSAYSWQIEMCHPQPLIWQCKEQPQFRTESCGWGQAGPHTCDLRHQKHCSYKKRFSWNWTEGEAEDRPAGLQLNGVSWEKAQKRAPLPHRLPHHRMLLVN